MGHFKLDGEGFAVLEVEVPKPEQAKLFETPEVLKGQLHLPKAVCPNCEQWQDANGDCFNMCKERGFV